MKKPFKLPHRYVVYDYLQGFGISVCLSSLVLITSKISFDVVYFFKVQRPVLIEKTRLDREQELADKQKEMEGEISVQMKLQEEAAKINTK